MTRDETIAIMGILKTAYPSFYRDMNRETALQAIALWTEMFADDSPAVVTAAVKALIKTRKEGYPPTIGEVTDKIRELTQGDELTGIEAWHMVLKACQNGYYGAAEEFAKLPPSVQKAVGAPSQLRDWAIMDPESLNVTGSHFQRAFRTIQQRERMDRMLPESVKKMLASAQPGLLEGP